MKTPPRKPFARFAHDVASSPFGAGKGHETDASGFGYTQNQLVAHGFLSKPLDLKNWDEQETSRLEKCLNSMLAKAADNAAHQSHLMAKYRNLASEYSRLETQTSRDTQIMITNDQEKEAAKAKVLAATKELASEVARHTIAKEEAARARLALQTVKSTAQYENKRREHEMAATIARWQKVTSPPNNSTCITLNPSHTIGRSYSEDVEASSGVRLLERSLKELEEARVVVQEENVHLREVIGDIASEVRATLQALGQEMPSLAEDTDEDLVSSSTPHLALSPDALTQYLSKLFVNLREQAVENTEQVRAELEQVRGHRGTESREKIEELEQSLAMMQADLDDVRAQLQDSQATVALLESKDESRSAERATNAEVEKKELRKQRKALEEERRKFTEAAARLQEERAELEKERLQAIEADRQRRIKESVEAPRIVDEEKVSAAGRRQPLAPNAAVKNSQQTSDASDRIKAVQKPVKKDLRASVTSAALQSILASTANTPPARPLLAVKTNGQQRDEGKRKADTVVAETTTSERTTVRRPPSSAALAARDRVQRAVRAAKAKSSSNA